MGLLERMNSENIVIRNKNNQLLENEKVVFETIKSMCTEKNEDKSGQLIRAKYLPSIHTLYNLENGIHVILSNDREHMFCFTGEITGRGICTGATILINTKGDNITRVEYGYADVDIENKNGKTLLASIGRDSKNMYFKTNFKRGENGGIINYSTEKEPTIDGSTIIEVIQQNMNSEEDSEKNIGDIILKDFGLILNLVPERDLKEESDLEILVRSMKRELEEKTLENASIERENRELKNKNVVLENEKTKLYEENGELKRRYDELIQKFKNVREFICTKCSKIPFIGKKIVKEMNNEIEAKELPEGR